MKGLLPFLVLVVACAPDIPQNPPPGARIVVQFSPGSSPPVVPLPNDLGITAGKVNVPVSPLDTPAQTEFNQQYLNTLDGFPFESTASVLVSAPLKPESVTPASVIGLDLTAAKAVPMTPAYVTAATTINVPPPAGGWTRGHQYAIALLAGPQGLQGANGEEVVGSETWALASSPQPLVDCPNGDLTSTDCTLAVDVIPSTKTDPAERLADQIAQAKQLEQIRKGYAPILAQLEATTGLPRAQIPIVWTFSIVDAAEATFDPANSVIPFPNDVLLKNNGKTTLVTLPNPKTGEPLTAADCGPTQTDATILLYCGLNSLDGFSTIAAPVSENSSAAGAAEQGTLDPTTVTAANVGLVSLGTKAPMPEQTGTPKYTPCINCLSSAKADGTPQTTQQLQWRLDTPLDEQTQYLAWVTGDVKDDKGKSLIANPVFALVRLANPLVDVAGHSTVNILSDAQAAQLEPLRKGLKPAIDALAAQGVLRTNLTLAWAFTTQSEATVLDKLHAGVNNPLLPDTPTYVYDATPQYQAIAHAAMIDDFSNVSKVLVGQFTTAVIITGQGGTFDPNNPKFLPVTFTLTLPSTPPPATGYPLAILGHGFTRSREDILAIAGALATPPVSMATIASDVLFHGERSSCTGSKSFISMATSDDAACADPKTQKCNEDPLIGRCVERDPTNPATHVACMTGPIGDQSCGAAGLGACLGSGFCEGGDFLRDNYAALSADPTTAPLVPFQRPVISGWNIFSLSNFFSTRDNFRQQVIDLSQLVRVITSKSAKNLASQAGVSFDPAQLGYVGQSLGGILGTLYNAVSPDTTNVVLNVPGGDLPGIILNAPTFKPYKDALVQTLASQGIMAGTPEFDQFLATAQWVLDPADPANMGYRLTHPVDQGGGVTAPNAKRKVFIQFIQGDETVPNVSNLALVAAANRKFTAKSAPPSYDCAAPLICYEFTDAINMFDQTSVPLASRHGFLLQPPMDASGKVSAAALALTTKAQTQVAQFLGFGAVLP